MNARIISATEYLTKQNTTGSARQSFYALHLQKETLVLSRYSNLLVCGTCVHFECKTVKYDAMAQCFERSVGFFRRKTTDVAACLIIFAICKINSPNDWTLSVQFSQRKYYLPPHPLSPNVYWAFPWQLSRRGPTGHPHQMSQTTGEHTATVRRTKTRKLCRRNAQ